MAFEPEISISVQCNDEAFATEIRSPVPLPHVFFTSSIKGVFSDNDIFVVPSNCNESECTHQLRVNCYSTRVSLNCSEASQGICRTFTVLEPRLAASLMSKSKPMFFREILCSMFCERFQQYRPCRVPVKCCVRLSFMLVVMTHRSCNNFGDR